MILIKITDGAFGNPGQLTKDAERQIYGLQTMDKEALEAIGYYIVNQIGFDSVVSVLGDWSITEAGYATRLVEEKFIDIEATKAQMILDSNTYTSTQIGSIAAKHVQEAYFDPTYVMPQEVIDQRLELLAANAMYKDAVNALVTMEEVLRYAW